MKLIQILSLLFLIIACERELQNNYQLETNFNPSSRESTLYLMKNNTKTDSLTVGDWYGKDSIYQVDSLNWKYFYSQRCGTGCSVTNQMLIKIEENRMKKIYDSLAYYTYHSVVIDSINGTTTNKLIEYDSVNIVKKDSIWYLIHKKYADGIMAKDEKKL